MWSVNPINRKSQYASQPVFRASLVVAGIFSFVFAFAPSWPSPAIAEAFDSEHSVHFDANSEKLVGENTMKEVSQFFMDAEKAIAAKDLDRLMAFYSDNYANDVHNKASVRLIWKRLFESFDKLYTQHNMNFVSISSDGQIIVIRCSGVLMGTPKSDNFSTALDHWINNDHTLMKESGKWKIMGTSGQEMKRFWFDKPLHPLF